MAFTSETVELVGSFISALGKMSHEVWEHTSLHNDKELAIAFADVAADCAVIGDAMQQEPNFPSRAVAYAAQIAVERLREDKHQFLKYADEPEEKTSYWRLFKTLKNLAEHS